MFSIIIPTHNRPQSLNRALESIYKQTLLPAEIIVIDDASEPAVSNLIFSNCPEEIKCHLIRNNISKKASGSRNLGILNSTQDYICFLDDDDEFLKNKIEIISKEIKNNNFPDLIYHTAEINLPNEKVKYKTHVKKISIENSKSEILISNFIGGTPVVTVKKSSILKHGLFDEKLSALEDYEMWIRMVHGDCTIHAINNCLTECTYISKKKSVSKDEFNNENALKNIYQKYQKNYEKLSFNQKKNYIESKLKDRLQRNLLNKNYLQSIKISASIFKNRKNTKNLLLIIPVLLGTKFIYKLRSWM